MRLRPRTCKVVSRFADHCAVAVSQWLVTGQGMFMLGLIDVAPFTSVLRWVLEMVSLQPVLQARGFLLRGGMFWFMSASLKADHPA